MIGSSECKLYSSILSSEVHIEYYDQVIMKHSRRVVGFTFYIRKSLSYNQVFAVTLKVSL